MKYWNDIYEWLARVARYNNRLRSVWVFFLSLFMVVWGWPRLVNGLGLAGPIALTVLILGLLAGGIFATWLTNRLRI